MGFKFESFRKANRVVICKLTFFRFAHSFSVRTNQGIATLQAMLILTILTLTAAVTTQAISTSRRVIFKHGPMFYMRLTQILFIVSGILLNTLVPNSIRIYQKGGNSPLLTKLTHKGKTPLYLLKIIMHILLLLDLFLLIGISVYTNYWAKATLIGFDTSGNKLAFTLYYSTAYILAWVIWFLFLAFVIADIVFVNCILKISTASKNRPYQSEV